MKIRAWFSKEFSLWCFSNPSISTIFPFNEGQLITFRMDGILMQPEDFVDDLPYEIGTGGKDCFSSILFPKGRESAEYTVYTLDKCEVFFPYDKENLLSVVFSVDEKMEGAYQIGVSIDVFLELEVFKIGRFEHQVRWADVEMDWYAYFRPTGTISNNLIHGVIEIL